MAISVGQISIADLNDVNIAILSTETGLVSVSVTGTPLNNVSFSTTMSIYKGNVLQTGWTFSRTQTNLTSTINASTGVLSITGISSNIGYVDITASKSGEGSFTKRYTLTKVYQGQSGEDVSPELVESIQGDILALGEDLATQAQTLSAQDTSITSLATRTTAIEGVNTTQATSISQNATGITSVATRMTTAESNISNHTSAITQNADAINLRVEAVDTDGNGVVGAKIEVATIDGAGQITIDADKILLNGSVKADKIDVDNLMTKELEVKNVIYSQYTKAGVPPSNGSGFWLGSSGKFRALNAEITGTLKTGPNALTNARVSVRDESGIIIGPSFVGSGLNDFTIITSGAVAVNARVRIKNLAVKYNIGDTGPAGGKIFHITDTNVYECAPASTQGFRLKWGPDGSLGLNSSAVGMGKPYTATIISTLGGSAPAASHCNNLSYGSYSDWYLPSFEELRLAITILGSAYGFETDVNGLYWSSTEYSASLGKVYGIYGGATGFTKTSSNSLKFPWTRAIRSFPVPKDTFDISVDNGNSYGSEILIPENKQYAIPDYNITFAFGSYTGHTSGDYWAFTQGDMKGLSIQSSNGNEYVSASAGVFSATQINSQGTTNIVWGAVAN